MKPLVPTLILVTVLLSAYRAQAKESPANSDEPQHAETESIGRVNELLLPPFQLSSLTKDLPANDLLFPDEQSLMILGSTALWQWRIGTNSLQRLVLWQDTDAQTKAPLRYLGGDGINLFVAADNTLFQIHWQENEIFRYPLPPGLKVRGFSGQADDYWLLHSGGIMQFDRYGKTLIPRSKVTNFATAEAMAYEPHSHILWAVRGNDLWRTDLKLKAPRGRVVFSAQHPLHSLTLPDGAHGDVMTHTDHAVLRFGESGIMRPSIPVEGSRRLIAMAISATNHAYLFSDQLLEVYEIQKKQTTRYLLPIDNVEQVSALRLSGQQVAVLVSGRPRLFRLDTGRRKR
jgi:hypothetical protein